jgi:hypothetical protein
MDSKRSDTFFHLKPREHWHVIWYFGFMSKFREEHHLEGLALHIQIIMLIGVWFSYERSWVFSKRKYVQVETILWPQSIWFWLCVLDISISTNFHLSSPMIGLTLHINNQVKRECSPWCLTESKFLNKG